ncbi:MAG TPA: hypothetical protein VK627_04670 [Edaphobacter sp.]|nr:hypothetical protein [Edaphobacter sp.]
MKRPFGLLLATIVLGLLALGQLLMATLMAIVTAAGRHVTPATAAVAVPAAQPFILFFGIGLSLFLAVLAVWAIFTIVGLLRLRNWARISVLIIGGCLAFFGCVSALGMIAGLFFASKFDTHSNAAPHMQAIVFGVMALFYAIVAAIGIAGLVYFNRAAIRALFIGAADYPLGPTHLIPPYGKPSRFAHVPTAITIIACLDFVSTVICAVMAFVPFPAFFLGFILTGAGAHTLYLALAILSGFLGYGLLHLDNRARIATLSLLGLGFLNMGLTLFPWYQSQFRLYNQQIMQKLQVPGVATTPTPDLTYAYMIVGVGFTLIFNGILFWLIQRHRGSFLRTPPPPTPA